MPRADRAHDGLEQPLVERCPFDGVPQLGVVQVQRVATQLAQVQIDQAEEARRHLATERREGRHPTQRGGPAAEDVNDVEQAPLIRRCHDVIAHARKEQGLVPLVLMKADRHVQVRAVPELGVRLRLDHRERTIRLDGPDDHRPAEGGLAAVQIDGAQVDRGVAAEKRRDVALPVQVGLLLQLRTQLAFRIFGPQTLREREGPNPFIGGKIGVERHIEPRVGWD